MAGLPCQPCHAEEHDKILDEVLKEQEYARPEPPAKFKPEPPAARPPEVSRLELDADAETETYQYHVLRKCLRSELKAFAQQYHFDELRNDMTQACEKLRSDLLKDAQIAPLRAPSREQPPSDFGAQASRSSRTSQGSVVSISALEREVKAPREIRMPPSFKDAREPRLKRSLTWSSWVADGDCGTAPMGNSNSTGLRHAGHVAFADQNGDTLHGNDSDHVAEHVPARPQLFKKKSGLLDERLPEPNLSKTMNKSPTKGDNNSGVTFYRYVTSRWSQKVPENHSKSKLSLSAAARLDSWKTKFVGCALAVEQFLDYPIAIAICFNGIFLGIQAQYQSVNQTESLPVVFPIVEIVFCFVFLSEILIRLVVLGKRFFMTPGVWWNAFDTSLVGMQLTEVVGMLTTSHEFSEAQASTNFSFLRLVRVLRLFRVLRLVRLLQFITELNVIISSIANSVRSLFWTMFLLMLMIYMVGITFTQVVFSYRMEVKGQEADEVEEQMEYWWGTLLRSTLSLYQAILGGVDWDTLVDPLTKRISVLLAPLFVLYIAFALLAMMNVITGIFVETAVKNAKKDKDNDFVRATKELFADGTTDVSGHIRQEDFESKMDREELQAFVRQVGIEPRDAKLMFRLIDSDCSGSLYLDQLLSGMLRLRSGVKVLDLAVMMHEQQNNLTELEATCLRQFEVMEKNMADMMENCMVRLSDYLTELVGKSPVPKQLLC